ncbi:hypothetical protein [Rosistilla ulvae]|uniref:hypothetical protein n=1 Tax=Rosistilla ulvae TaxID=1930277 RepID=UPI0011A0C3E3|nr:hypothetical protein [Rosistilla ulvae]
MSERYSGSQSNVYETFADLIFCALIVLVLFVLTLAVEVSQRVRAKIPEVAEVTVVEDIHQLSVDEVAELSEKLQKQRAEMNAQREQMLRQQEQIETLRANASKQADAVASKMAALDGEQRFTGATEPASVLLAYEYEREKLVFIRRKEFDHATTRRGGETTVEFLTRQVREMVDLALASRKQRFYTIEEANAIYAAFSEYQQINPSDDSYSISSERIGVIYASKLSGYIAGDKTLSDSAVAVIERVINSNFDQTSGESDAMYPAATVIVGDQQLMLNGVALTAKDFKDILLAFGGRGVMLDFEGYTGKAPDWLVKQVLEPTGYIGKTPKLPGS